nr:hypothetical protein [Tanacetum cinerariifolium]
GVSIRPEPDKAYQVSLIGLKRFIELVWLELDNPILLSSQAVVAVTAWVTRGDSSYYPVALDFLYYFLAHLLCIRGRRRFVFRKSSCLFISPNPNRPMGGSAPSNDIVDFEILDKLDDNCTLIRKYPETFLCLVGLSRSFANLDARPTLLCRDKSDMGLLDFVKYSDPFKVRTEERTLASSEVPLLTETADMVVNSCAQSIRLVTHTITNEINTHAGKNKRKVGFSNATPPVKKVRTGEGVRVNEHVTTAGNLFLSFRSSLLRVVRPVLILGVSLPMLRNLCLLLLLLPWNIGICCESLSVNKTALTASLAAQRQCSDIDLGTSVISVGFQVVAATKLPILNLNKFDMWKMRIEQYFLMSDYCLWEVILNGDSPTPIRIIDGVVQVIAPTTAEQNSAKKNELKARGTLLMALPDKHQLKFNIYKDAKSFIEAIEKRFGGNKETKKPSERKTHTLIWRNKADLEEQSLDDLFNNLKIYEAEVNCSSLTSPNTQNIAFVSSNNTDCTTESVSTIPSVSDASSKALVSTLLNVDNLNLEEMDLKWQIAMLTMRARRFLQRTGRNLGANRTTAIGFDMSKVECCNCHRRGHFDWECRSPRDHRNKDTPRRTVLVETSTSNALVSQCNGVGSYDWSFQAEEPKNYALMAFTSLGLSNSSVSDSEVAPCSKTCSKAYGTLPHYDKLTVDFRKSQFDVLSYESGLESVEARLVVYQQNENVFEEDIKLLKLDVMLRDNALVELRNKLLESQITDKTGLGCDNQVFNSTVFDCDEFNISESDESVYTSPVHDRYKSGEGYHVVSPPYTGTFMPLKPDLVFHDAPTANFKEINGGYVTFGGNPKGGNITGKDTECVVLSSDFKLPDLKNAKAVNTACCVQNKVLVTKPHNKTPYELLLGRTPSIGLMRPFGYPVTILNTLDPLRKFDRKADEGFLVGYFVNSKAFRVFNSRTRIVQETLHINFLKNQPNVAGSGPKWLFDIDTLTQSMNYQPVVAGNQPNHSAGIKENLDADPHNIDDDVAFDVKKNESEVHVSLSSSDKPKKHDEKAKREPKGKSPVDLSIRVRDLRDEFKEFSINSTNRVNAASASVSPIPTTRVHKDHPVTQIIGDLTSAPQTRSMARMEKEQGGLTQINNEDFHTCMFACFLSQEKPKRVHQALKDPSWIEAM